MKNNNYKMIKSRVIQAIDKLFEQNGKLDIPDVKEVCSVAKTSRKTAVKYLYEWWEKYHSSDKNAQLINYLPALHYSPSEDILENVTAHLNCLIKEVEIHSESLNFLPDTDYPLGNYIADSLLEIQDKVLGAHNSVKDIKHKQEFLVAELKSKETECSRLYDDINEIEAVHAKKVSQLREELEATRREATAARHLAKSLKREKRTRAPNFKNLFYYYKLHS